MATETLDQSALAEKKATIVAAIRQIPEDSLERLRNVVDDFSGYINRGDHHVETVIETMAPTVRALRAVLQVQEAGAEALDRTMRVKGRDVPLIEVIAGATFEVPRDILPILSDDTKNFQSRVTEYMEALRTELGPEYTATDTGPRHNWYGRNPMIDCRNPEEESRKRFSSNVGVSLDTRLKYDPLDPQTLVMDPASLTDWRTMYGKELTSAIAAAQEFVAALRAEGAATEASAAGEYTQVEAKIRTEIAPNPTRRGRTDHPFILNPQGGGKVF